MKNGQTMNRHEKGQDLYEITITPKGEREAIKVYVNATSRLDAHNYMINNKHFGTQHQISLYHDARFLDK